MEKSKGFVQKDGKVYMKNEKYKNIDFYKSYV